MAQLTGGSTGPPGTSVQRREVAERIRQAPDQLEPMDREALALRHYEQLTHAEAAQVLGNVNGVSLYVFFDDGNDANNRDVYLLGGFDANINNSFDAPGIGFTATGVQYAGGTARLVTSMRVGRTRRATAPSSSTSHRSTRCPAGRHVYRPVRPVNSPFPDMGRYDVMPFDITSHVGIGSNMLTLSHAIDTDLLALHVAAIDVAAVPEPAGVAVLRIAALCVLRRQRR